MDLTKFKFHKPTKKLNKMLLPVNNLGFNDVDIETFNSIYIYCKENIEDKFVSTSSGGISISAENYRGPRWMITVGKTFVEIVLKNFDAKIYRFIVGYKKDKKENLSGRQAFFRYCKELEKDGVDISTLAISTEEGKEVKKTIPAPRIELCVLDNLTYRNAHHIDINSAYNAGMMKAYPILEKSVRRMYNMRKINTEFKNVLNMTQGVMQSSLVQYKYAHISKAGYEYTLNYLADLTKKLEDKGYRILSYNTDGIWYQGETQYHDENEGTDIGQWKHDYSYCKVRYKSKGCYEIESPEKGYVPVFRGESTYEKVKPRSEWVWGDIFKGDVVQYYFDSNKGIVKYEE